MKRIRLLCMCLCLLVLLGSCLDGPLDTSGPVPWLCSINADGTGFRKIKKVDLNFGTNGFWDIYMTKDNRIIFYGDKLWISDTDVIEPVQITPDNLFNFNKPQLSFTLDGNSVFFSASRDIYSLKFDPCEVIKITETPVDYYWAEPILSDNERFVTMRGYWGKSPEAQSVYSYVDLTDKSLHNIYATNYLSAPYKGKIIEEMNGFILENRHGFGSINLEDSTFTLLQPYSASYKNMFETTPDQNYLITKYNQSSNTYGIVIDLHDNTRFELGEIKDHDSCNPIKVCKDANLVYYMDQEHIYKYDLVTHTKSTIFGPSDIVGVYRVIMLAPTWDGSKVYFYAEISER